MNITRCNWGLSSKMEYLKANLDDYAQIINLKNEVKQRVIKEDLPIWLNDYPNDDLIKDDILKGYARIITNGVDVIAYTSVHPAAVEYAANTFCRSNLYSFSRLMVSDSYLGQGMAKTIIKCVLEECKIKADGVGLIVDAINERARLLYEKVGFKYEGPSRQIYGDFINYTYYYNEDKSDLLNYELAKQATLATQLFNQKIYKTRHKILGLKTPALRQVAKKLPKDYLFNYCFRSSEEIMLATMMLSKLEGEELIASINKILTYADSWAITDGIASSVKKIRKNPLRYLPYLESLITSNQEFVVRTGIVILLAQFRELDLYSEIKRLTKLVKLDTYYVNMALAWLMCSMSFNDVEVIEFVKQNFNEEVNKMFHQKRRDSLRDKQKYREKKMD